MKIQYLGHSSFCLESGIGTRIVTDPYAGIGFPFPYVEADIVTVSHGHFDHCNVSGVEGAPKVVSDARHFVAGDIAVDAFECFHDDAHGTKRGKNLIFKFNIDGISICHLGDIGERCSSHILEFIAKPDVLLIPVGGNYTIDAQEAKKYIEHVKPSVVIPMHYAVAGLTVDIAPLSDFTELFEKMDIEYCGSELMLTKEDLVKRCNTIIVMERV